MGEDRGICAKRRNRATHGRACEGAAQDYLHRCSGPRRDSRGSHLESSGPGNLSSRRYRRIAADGRRSQRNRRHRPASWAHVASLIPTCSGAGTLQARHDISRAYGVAARWIKARTIENHAGSRPDRRENERHRGAPAVLGGTGPGSRGGADGRSPGGRKSPGGHQRAGRSWRRPASTCLRREATAILADGIKRCSRPRQWQRLLMWGSSWAPQRGMPRPVPGPLAVRRASGWAAGGMPAIRGAAPRPVML